MLFQFLVGSVVVVNIGSVLAAVQFKGTNIAGFDFGCSTDGACICTEAYGALTELDGPDGAGQMVHFTNTDSFNLYRLPVGWQYLVNDVLGGPLDPTNSANYDKLVQACLVTGSHCLIDIHNYARWNGAIIGQGGPTNDQFASLWSQLATKYVLESKVLFGLMNEPHDLPDINLWAASVQAAVTAIRTAGATSQIILLPGNDYTSAETFVSGGSAAALCAVSNLDGSKTNLVFDVHKYFDSDGSGTNADCVSNQIDTSFSPLATYLRANNRQALLSETGGGSSSSDCLLAVCQALSYLDANSDVYLGYSGWAAGSFPTDYVLSMTPFGSAATGWTDQALVSQCFAMSAAGSNSSTTALASAATTTTTSVIGSLATTTLDATASQATTASVSFTTDAVPVSAPSATSSVSTTSFAYSYTAAGLTYTNSPVSMISTSAVSTSSFSYTFTAAALTYTDSSVCTISASSISTTSLLYTFTAAALTYTDSPVFTSCTCTLTQTPTDVFNGSSTVPTSTTFEYSYIPAPTTTGTSTTVYPYGAETSVFPSTTTASLNTASTTEMYSFTPALTVGPTQAAPVVSATPSGFTTMVRPSSTGEAASAERTGAGDDDTCSA